MSYVRFIIIKFLPDIVQVVFDLSVLCQKIVCLYNTKKVVFDIALNYGYLVAIKIKCQIDFI
ncbi:hypothetical protein JCM37173_17380 [Allocoprococcus similis]